MFAFSVFDRKLSMFDFIRKHTRIMQILLFLLVFPSFVLFGLEGYNRSRDKGPVAAEVDGHGITQTEWDAAHKREVERLRASMPTADVKLLDSPQVRYATLERLVRDRVLEAAVGKLKLVTSDARLASELQQNQTIAALRKPDGTLDLDQYRQLLASQGITPEVFEARVRAESSSRQVMTGVTRSAFATQAQADAAVSALFERREIQVVPYTATQYQSKVVLTDADLAAYYQRNTAQFQAPEQADVEYLVLDLDAITKNLSLNEADVRSYYEQNVARLSGQEERRASHILINAPKTATPAERDSARAKANELLQAVRKAPDSFADVARKNSQDPGSAANGGDLDFFRRGAMVKPFEDSVFALKKGDISDVVESEFGFHIIRLTDIKAPKQPSFEELRPKLEAELRKQQAQRKFAEVADTFTNGVYEQADSFKKLAEQLKLEVQTARQVTRKPAPGATGVLVNPKFLAAVFSADAIEKKHNTEALELGANQLVSARVVQYTPARTQTLAEVKDQVRNLVLAERAVELARKEGEAQLAAWRAHPEQAQLPGAITVSRDATQQQDPKLLERVLRVDASTLPAWIGVDLGTQGYAVARVNKVVPRPTDDDAAHRKHLAQYNQLWGGAEAQAYLGALKERLSAEIRAAKPKAVSADSTVSAQ
jgi:peptidyl-prolyl cis-trans isomerase D